MVPSMEHQKLLDTLCLIIIAVCSIILTVHFT
jgi:hypothetical protein